MEETRRQKFQRLSESRKEDLKERLRILGNLANPSSYEYSQEEVDSIFSEIVNAMQEAKSKFEKNLPDRKTNAKKSMKTGPDENVSIGGKSNATKRKWSKKTLVDVVIEALRQLGGCGRYADIYRKCEELSGRETTMGRMAAIRKTIEDHSSDSANFQHGADYFYKVEKGTWGLRKGVNSN